MDEPPPFGPDDPEYNLDEPWQTQRFRRMLRGTDGYLGRRSPMLRRGFHALLIVLLLLLGLALLMPLVHVLGGLS